MDHALYESNPDRSEQVLGIHADIRDRKLARVKVSLQEVRKWEQKRDKLREAMEHGEDDEDTASVEDRSEGESIDNTVKEELRTTKKGEPSASSDDDDDHSADQDSDASAAQSKKYDATLSRSAIGKLTDGIADCDDSLAGSESSQDVWNA